MATKKDYQVAFNTVRDIVNKLDPPGLVAGGAPQDEYDGEISKILPLLRNIHEIDALGQKIFEIFSDSLLPDNAGNRDAYNELAREILKKYPSGF